MKMVTVRLVVIGAEYYVEEGTGSVPHRSQEGCVAGPVSFPIPCHCHFLPVSQHKTCNVDCIGGRMLAPAARRTMINVAAGMSALMNDTHDSLSEVAARRGTDHMAVEQGPCHRERA